MKAIFVAGTDTGVGKTVITGLLARHMQDRGLRVITQKWVQTGTREGADDVAGHLRMMGKTRKDFRAWESLQVPYRFRFPSSPLLAARREGRSISTAVIKSAFRKLSRSFDAVIVEGAGGLLVPIARGVLQARLVGELGLPVLLVAGNRLGAINQALLSLEALESRGIRTVGVVFNAVKPGIHPAIARDNGGMVKSFSGTPVLAEIPWMRKKTGKGAEFYRLGDSVMAALGLHGKHRVGH